MTTVFTPTELYESRKERRRGDQSTGERSWVCLWEQRYGSWLPKYKKSKYTDGTEDEGLGTAADRLICTGYDFDGIGAGKVVGGKTYPFDLCKVKVHYAESAGFDTTPEEEWSGTARTMNVADGRVWPDGSPCDIPINKVFPQGQLVIPRYFVFNQQRRVGLLSSIGKVNATWWRGFAPETLRFDFPQMKQKYDDTTGKLMDRVIFRFTYEPMTHQMVWRNGTWLKPWPLLCMTTNFDLLLGGGWENPSSHRLS